MRKFLVIFSIAFSLGFMAEKVRIDLLPYCSHERPYEELPDSTSGMRYYAYTYREFLLHPDTNCYNEYVSHGYRIKGGIYSDNSIYTLITANKFNWGDGYFRLYKQLQADKTYYMNAYDFLLKRKFIYKTDDTTKELAIHFLKQGAALGDSSSIKELMRISYEN